jgi:phosphate transport system permease protein
LSGGSGGLSATLGARPRVRAFFKPILEVLAGIPTVVYGFFALQAVTPLLQDIWPGGEGPQVFNALSAGFVMGIMIIPTRYGRDSC